MFAPLQSLIQEATNALTGEPLVAAAEKHRLERVRGAAKMLAAYIATMPPTEQPVSPKALELAAQHAGTPQGRDELYSLLEKVREAQTAPSVSTPRAEQLSSSFAQEAVRTVVLGVIAAIAIPYILRFLGVGGEK